MLGVGSRCCAKGARAVNRPGFAGLPFVSGVTPEAPAFRERLKTEAVLAAVCDGALGERHRRTPRR